MPLLYEREERYVCGLRNVLRLFAKDTLASRVRCATCEISGATKTPFELQRRSNLSTLENTVITISLSPTVNSVFAIWHANSLG
jgi:hypothetical protein